jgi:2-keto-4-pentenoate hydratase/2-oxohepta-3-ene-1,7-dioic acid hydratase in catechol pathway
MAFCKTPNALAGPFEDIPFSSELKEMDYEVQYFAK